MTNNSRVNKYAKGLFNISVKNNSTGDVRNGLDSIIKISKSIPEFKHVLFTKNTSREDKKSILSNVLRNKIDLLALELLIILIENDEAQLFADISNKYNQLMSVNATELDISITSNVEFSSDELSSIKKNFSEKLNKHINIKTHVDKKLLGGVQLRIGNTIIDNSLSSKLTKLKNNLKNNQVDME